MEEESVFSYDKLNRLCDDPSNKRLGQNGYVFGVIPTNREFIGFYRMESSGNECEEGRIFKKHGLKFHISLPEYDPEMFKRGWDIVCRVLMHHQVVSFKVIRAAYKMSDKKGQEGKDVTVLADANLDMSAAQWKTVLEEITNRLVEAGVKPGYRTQGTEEKQGKYL